jgi:hypothetical protein
MWEIKTDARHERENLGLEKEMKEFGDSAIVAEVREYFMMARMRQRTRESSKWETKEE